MREIRDELIAEWNRLKDCYWEVLSSPALGAVVSRTVNHGRSPAGGSVAEHLTGSNRSRSFDGISDRAYVGGRLKENRLGVLSTNPLWARWERVGGSPPLLLATLTPGQSPTPQSVAVAGVTDRPSVSPSRVPGRPRRRGTSRRCRSTGW